MAGVNAQLTKAAEDYFGDLRRVRTADGATGERSKYGPLANPLNAIGGTLKPKVFCVGEMADQGAGHPDFSLYAVRQVQRGKPRYGQVPECGVIEVKPATDDAWLTASSDQVSRYWERYRLVLVTNTRDFVLLGEDAEGRPAKLETFRLAESASEFASRLETPRVFANAVGAALDNRRQQFLFCHLAGASSHAIASAFSVALYLRQPPSLGKGLGEAMPFMRQLPRRAGLRPCSGRAAPP